MPANRDRSANRAKSVRIIVMKKIKTRRYDVAEHLRTPKEMAAYLEACLDDAGGDAAFIAKALGDIARAKGMAKVARDAMMVELDAIYPQYGFADHKGYGTRVHLDALERYGPCPAHRRSYAPVRQPALPGLA